MRGQAPAPAVWVRKNLLSSPLNVALTVVMGAFVAWVVYRAARWVLVTAEWGVLKANLRAYMVGRFPDDEIWRIWVALFMLAALTGLSRGLLRRGPLTRPGLAGRLILAPLAVAIVVWLVESTLVLAALAADGTSIIGGVEHVDRGYEQIESKLVALGAQINRTEA